jgi:hypothetical protein
LLYLSTRRGSIGLLDLPFNQGVGSPTSGGSSGGSSASMIRKKSMQQIALERYKGMHASFRTSAGGIRFQKEGVW